MNLVRGFISNRRKARRIPVAIPLRLAILRKGRGGRKDQRSRSIAARTFDLSSSGLGIEASVIQIDNFHLSISSDMTSEQCSRSSSPSPRAPSASRPARSATSAMAPPKATTSSAPRSAPSRMKTGRLTKPF